MMIQRESFIHELRRITGVSEADALKAYFSTRAAPTVSPERQARIYANLYGLDKPEVKEVSK